MKVGLFRRDVGFGQGHPAARQFEINRSVHTSTRALGNLLIGFKVTIEVFLGQFHQLGVAQHIQMCARALVRRLLGNVQQGEISRAKFTVALACLVHIGKAIEQVVGDRRAAAIAGKAERHTAGPPVLLKTHGPEKIDRWEKLGNRLVAPIPAELHVVPARLDLGVVQDRSFHHVVEGHHRQSRQRVHIAVRHRLWTDYSLLDRVWRNRRFRIGFGQHDLASLGLLRVIGVDHHGSLASIRLRQQRDALVGFDRIGHRLDKRVLIVKARNIFVRLHQGAPFPRCGASRDDSGNCYRKRGPEHSRISHSAEPLQRIPCHGCRPSSSASQLRAGSWTCYPANQ